ncbi:MAG TPA: PQQ-binding-like beta-propeller repeat protein [Ktedonobacterales bacterium]|nr:PQQ-binding-like beta-propeller repeat protein [Ktedonobacterales bacterium]
MPSQSLLIMGSPDGWLRAFTATNGALIWERHIGHSFSDRALACAGETLFACAVDQPLFSVRLTDGAKLWEAPEPSGIPSVMANEAVVVVQAGFGAQAFRPQDGAHLWDYTAQLTVKPMVHLLAVGIEQAYILNLDVPIPLPPPVAIPPDLTADERKERLRIPSRPSRLLTFAFSASDGALRWQTNTVALPADDGASSLVERDGVVYTCGEGLHALNAATGETIWAQMDVPRYPVASYSMLTTSSTLLFFITEQHLGAYSRATGALVWSIKGLRLLPDSTYSTRYSQMVVMDDVLYVGHVASNPSGFHLEARDCLTGALLRRWPEQDEVEEADVAWRFQGASGMLYVPTWEGLFAIDAATLKMRWKIPQDSPTPAFLAIPRID